MSPSNERRLDHLMALREEALEEMAAGEAEMSRHRTRIERLESDQRLGAPVTDEYEHLKGHQLPRAERRLLDAYDTLIKLEGKILDARAGR